MLVSSPLKTRRNGFTLLEMAIVVGIIAVLLGTFIAFYGPMQKAKQRQLTQVKIDKAMDAVSAFLIRENRLPFAATAVNGVETPAATNIQRGIIPYATLGLSPDDVRDGFGHYMTYVVDPRGGNLSSTGGSTAFDTFQDVFAADDNRSRFCYTSGKQYFGAPGAASANGFTVNRNGAPETTRALVAIVSHGPTGAGAFNDAMQVIDLPRGAAETNNQATSASNNVDINDYNGQVGNNAFDDIVAYQTGRSLVSRLGTTNCHDYTEQCSCKDVCELMTNANNAERYRTATSCRINNAAAANSCYCKPKSSGTGGDIAMVTTARSAPPALPIIQPNPGPGPGNPGPGGPGGGPVIPPVLPPYTPPEPVNKCGPYNVTMINIGSSQEGSKPGTNVPMSAWSDNYVLPDAGPALEDSTAGNPSIYYVENVNKTFPRFWTAYIDSCTSGVFGSVEYILTRTNSDPPTNPASTQVYHTVENNAAYLMMANGNNFGTLYAANHPLFGFVEMQNGQNIHDSGFLKGPYTLTVNYRDQKGSGPYPSQRSPQGNITATQTFYFRIVSKQGIGAGPQ